MNVCRFLELFDENGMRIAINDDSILDNVSEIVNAPKNVKKKKRKHNVLFVGQVVSGAKKHKTSKEDTNWE